MIRWQCLSFCQWPVRGILGHQWRAPFVLTLNICWWQKTRVGTRADTGGERMCEVQPEWNVREDHSERAGTLFVLIASREGKQQPLLPRCFLSIFYVFLSWLLSRMNITLFYPSSWIICSIWGEGRGGGGGRQAGDSQASTGSGLVGRVSCGCLLRPV